MRRALVLVACLSLSAFACSAAPSSEASSEAEINQEAGDAVVRFTSDFQTEIVGKAAAGKGLRIEYALDRLPQCRGNVGGGGPGWAITGYYSENGGPAKTFDPTALTEDGMDRVSQPVTIPLTQGGDLSLWFAVSSRWGCHEYDSAYGQNFHVDVEGAPPKAEASIVFGKDGSVTKEGTLEAGGKLLVRYEQARLSKCERVQGGLPQWAIGGHASFDGGEEQVFQTGRAEGPDRVAIDAVLDIPAAKELALWFSSNAVGGCTETDSNGGKNYVFEIE